MANLTTNDRGELVRAAITKAQTEAAQGYRIEDNEKFHSKEIYFTGIPSQSTRDALKALKFRWHGQKRCWYGFASNEEIASACGDVLTIPATKVVNKGSIYEGWEGGNNKKWRDDKELKNFILSDCKRCGIKASIRFNRAGYLTSLTVTVTLSKDHIKPFEDFKKSFDVLDRGYWLNYQNDEGRTVDIHRDNFLTLPEDEQKALFEKICSFAYENDLNRLSYSDGYRGEVLTEEGNNIMKSVHAIVDSYNRDCSDIMTDYFDRAIYDSYCVKIA